MKFRCRKCGARPWKGRDDPTGHGVSCSGLFDPNYTTGLPDFVQVTAEEAEMSDEQFVLHANRVIYVGTELFGEIVVEKEDQ